MVAISIESLLWVMQEYEEEQVKDAMAVIIFSFLDQVGCSQVFSISLCFVIICMNIVYAYIYFFIANKLIKQSRKKS